MRGGNNVLVKPERPPPQDQPSLTTPSTEPVTSESTTLHTQNLEQPTTLKNTGFSITTEQLKQIIPTLPESKCNEYLP